MVIDFPPHNELVETDTIFVLNIGDIFPSELRVRDSVPYGASTFCFGVISVLLTVHRESERQFPIY